MMAQVSYLDSRLLVARCMLSLLLSKLALGSISPCTIVSVRNSSVFYQYEYDSLQDALEFAASQEDSNCTEILLLPNEQYFVVRPVTIGSSLTMRSLSPSGRAKVTLTAERTPTPADGFEYDPFFVLTVWNTDFVNIDGVAFSESSGIINLQNVTNVTVSNCGFR